MTVVRLFLLGALLMSLGTPVSAGEKYYTKDVQSVDAAKKRALRMLSSLLLPILRERFPSRGLVEGAPPDPCATFPGTHPGIRSVSIYDEGHELTISVDDLTHGHFAEYDNGLSEAEREQRIVEAVVEFLDALFANQVAVWGQVNAGGGWYRIDLGGSGGRPGVPEFVWSGPRA